MVLVWCWERIFATTTQTRAGGARYMLLAEHEELAN